MNFSTGRIINKATFDNGITSMDKDHTGQFIFCGDAQDLAQPPESFVDKSPASETATPSSSTSKGAYVPPSHRAGADRSRQDMRHKNDEKSVRVTNLSKDTREPDLQDLFNTFGPVSRVYIAYDQKTGMSRGFGFVNYVQWLWL
ncbi:hypothetical protein IFM89_003639 [Coptis chinensis]|uniref:RRM domain-containing protein n=1 Tax=Coptis chinensis TaxID=261450 RepID=A0A835MBL9_9MAGN|nr:hypothetical protein IFM89_003639 [Coptis chinensis]